MESRRSRRLRRGEEKKGKARIGGRARYTRSGQWISFIMDVAALIHRLFGPRAEKKYRREKEGKKAPWSVDPGRGPSVQAGGDCGWGNVGREK